MDVTSGIVEKKNKKNVQIILGEWRNSGFLFFSKICL